MNDDISRLLNAAVPEEPDPARWAEAARRKARARRLGRGTLVAGGFALLALAVAVPALTLLPEQPSAVPAEEVAPSSASMTPPCASLSEQAAAEPEYGALPLADGDLPKGAERIWLCTRDEHVQGSELVPEIDHPLTVRVDEAVESFNGRGRYPAGQECTAEGPSRTWLAVVEYPSGPRYVAFAVDGGCPGFYGDWPIREGSDEWLTVLRELWGEHVLAPGENPCAVFEDPEGPRVDIPLEPGDLPEGATGLWLCGDESTPGRSGMLTDGVDEAIASYNEFSPLPTDVECTAEYSLLYTVVLEYPDGQKFVQGELHGCQALLSEPRRAGGREWYDELGRLFDTQG